MPDDGDRIWTVGRLLRAGVTLTLLAVAAVGATGLLRNDEIRQRESAVRRSTEVLARIGDLRTAIDTPAPAMPGTDPAATQALRDRAAEAGRVAGTDPVHRRLLARIDPAGDPAVLRAAVDGMRRHEQARLDRQLSETGAVARTNRWLIVWVSVLAALFVLAGGRWLERRLTGPVGELEAAVRRGRPAAVRSPRELAELARVHNASLAATTTARAEANAASAAGAAFLDAMHAEVRTPLAALTGMTAMLLEGDLDGRQRELAATVHASGTALRSVVDDLLDLARIESGDLVLDRRPFSLRGCLRRAMDPVVPAAAAKGLHLSGHLASGCPERVRGDEKRVRRILTTLLRQAVAETGHGAVTVSVSVPSGGAVRLSVRDNGLGVPSGGPPDPGLLLARRLAESMGGGLVTEARPGEGTTVTVTVRLDAVVQPVRAPQPVDGRKTELLVLVVEDDPVDQRLTRRMLERRGHRVLTLGDGEAAVEAVQRDRYDLVLIGSGLLVLDGPTAVRLIRADPPPHGCPRLVAVCSDDEEREEFTRARVDGFLGRPVDAGELDVVLATAAAFADVRLAGIGPLPGPGDGEPATIRACADVIAGPDAEPGDRRRLAEILHNFADRLPGLLARMDAAAASGDTRNLVRLAHGLKASSATLGANRFAALCADLEERAGDDRQDPAAVLRDLHERAREVSETMETISQQLTRAA